MKLAVVGSRGYPLPGLVRHFIQEIAHRSPDTVIISGGARGVDTWAADAARLCGLTVVVFPADWDQHGKAAGFVRNTQECDVLLAFWDSTSRGTLDPVRKARKAGKKVRVLGPLGTMVDVL